MTSSLPSLSIIIANYNYADYVGFAIDSALAVDWPQVQVIVVDDGSTDASRGIIDRYGDRIVRIYQSNAGQAVASSEGFALATGDVVIFLDSDDALDPTIGAEIARVWHDGVSKVQFQMKTIDARGRELGTVFPQYHEVPTPSQILSWVLTTTAYPTPPGSGNAYSRRRLARVFPLDGSLTASDAYFLAAAPFLGDVVTVPRPLVSYRVHGRNDGAMSSLDGASRFAREVARSTRQFAYSQRIAAEMGYELPSTAATRSLSILPYRIALFRLAPRHELNDKGGRWHLLGDAVRAANSPQGISMRGRLALMAWSALVLLAPLGWSQRLIEWRFVPTSRPRRVVRMLTGLGIVR